MGKYKKRKDGRYATTVMVGYKPDGKPMNVFISAKTEKELKQKIIDVKVKVASGQLIKNSDTLFAKYAESWMCTYKSTVGINTKAMYQNIINHHLNPALGHLPLKEIKRSDVQKLINDNQEHPRICEQIRMTMNQIFQSAIDDKLIAENVAKKSLCQNAISQSAGHFLNWKRK